MRELMEWVWQHSKSEVPILIASMIAASTFSSLASLSLLYASKFIDMVGKGFDADKLMPLGGIVLGITVVVAGLRLLAATLGAYASTNIRRNLEIRFFGHLSRLPFHYLEEKSHGRITAALMAEVPMVAGIIPMIIRSFVRAPVAILVVIAVLIYSSPWVALVSLITLPAYFLGVNFFTRRIRAKSQESMKGVANMYAKMNENLGGIRVVRCLGLLDYFAAKMQDLSRTIAKTSRQGAIIGAVQGALQEIIAMAILVSFLIWLALQVLEGTMQIGQALLVPACFVYLRTEVMALVGGYISMKSIEVSAQRLRELLMITQENEGEVTLEGPLHRILLRDVTFAYADGPNVLEKVNLQLLPGKLTVIIGESGVGKSTLCDLCLRLRTPTAGSILYDDIPIGQLSEDFLRQASALVEQEPFLFEGTIRQNLLLSCPKADDDMLWQALAAAGAADFVRELPEKLDADVGQRGVKLSVGQKQRIVLARALIRKPRFLVLDEFTSSLDVEHESEIIENLMATAGDTIVLCATHRASIVAKADEVYLLERRRLRRVDKAECLIQLGSNALGSS
jgi:ABC-type multidrug transport system fused ATPase/permease subunit